MRPMVSRAVGISLLLFIGNIQAAAVTGTGFFITANGYLVTSFHVVRDAKSISIRTRNGEQKVATVAGVDSSNDLVILKVEGVFDALPIGPSRAVRPGMKVITMGFPHVDIQGQEPKVTEGIISSATGIGNDPTVFQISVPVQAGNSGGPLVTMGGSVVGIVSSKLNSVSVANATGDLPQNVNYAVKSNYLLELASTQERIEANLLTPRRVPFTDTEQVADALAKSVVLVVAEVADRKVPPLAKVTPTALPTAWVSLQSGEQYSIRWLDDRLQWVETRGFPHPSLEGCTSTRRGEAVKTGDGLYTGDRFESTSCPRYSSRCSFTLTFRITKLTPSRIEGELDGYLERNTRTCETRGGGRRPFVWIPQ